MEGKETKKMGERGEISLSNHIKIMLHITKVSKFKCAKRKERFKDTTSQTMSQTAEMRADVTKFE